MLKKNIIKFLPKAVKEKIIEFRNNNLDGYAIKSYSQEGEDMILKRLFGGQKFGFYVDVGAHHPKRFSNTYFFYKKGWSGINIDAMPGSMIAFDKFRPRDINIEKPISDKKQILTYYAFNEPALNTFSKELAVEYEKENYFIKFTRDIEATTLEDILDRNLPRNQDIDFLSVDVEGLDLMVLRSNNFEKYKPKIVLIEILGNSFSEIENNKIADYLRQYGYSIFAKTVNTVFFVNNSFKKDKLL
ncbi:SAM-dependent methyltransferase [Campylobacter concisus]|uniref:FkbM family methyltransferase n=1 Tax=Campylobacter concisus TaxID=199 RepID=UPI000B3D681E|nr:FkbM family methyltransferase [Campylobacter concisus]OUT15969.1 SAM-dependent methyltransferase [Campylobacter concisus]